MGEAQITSINEQVDFLLKQAVAVKYDSNKLLNAPQVAEEKPGDDEETKKRQEELIQHATTMGASDEELEELDEPVVEQGPTLE
jgi:hypothetical protein